MPSAWRIVQFAAPVTIIAVDAMIRRWQAMPLAFLGLLDETAHVATALLASGGLRLPRSRGATIGLLTGATALDLDHVPQYVGWEVLARRDHRPVTHSLGSALVTLVLALAGPAPWRTPLMCAGVGIATQLLRDLSTGSGVPLWWPVSRSMVRIPYPVYLVLVLVAALLTGRRTSESRSSSAS